MTKLGACRDLDSAFMRMTAGLQLTMVAFFLMTHVSGEAKAMAGERRYTHPELSSGILRLPFSRHSFSARCFDTLKCQVLYANRYEVTEKEPSPPFTALIRKNLYAGTPGIENFPPPARVVWVSKDGASHEAEVDIGEIFKDQQILYSPELDVYDVPLDGDFDDPDIVLVVENRKISVYMRAHISLLHPRIAGNKFSDFRADLILAFARNY